MDARHPRDVQPDPVLTTLLGSYAYSWIDPDTGDRRVESSRPRKRGGKAQSQRNDHARPTDAAGDRNTGRKPKAGSRPRRDGAEPVGKRRAGDGVPRRLNTGRGTGGQRHRDPDNQRGQDPARLKLRGNTAASATEARGSAPNASRPPKADPASARPFSHRPHPKWMYHFPDERNQIIEEQAAEISRLQKELRRVHRKTA